MDRAKKGVLFLIPTPIGNLKDITLRAIDTLKKVDAVYAEDTRETEKLFSKYGVNTELKTFYGGQKKKIIEILKRIQKGEHIAIVSDRGTPGISDPGEKIVKEAIKQKTKIVSLPGPNAFITSLVASGLSTKRVVFEGFLPKSGAERENKLNEIAVETGTVVLYESPKRLVKTLKDLKEYIGKERRAVVAREVTKIYEEYVRGTVGELYENFKNETPKGELVLIISGKEKEEPTIKDGRVKHMIDFLLRKGISVRDSAKIVSYFTGVSKNELYELGLKVQKDLREGRN